jgi:hypothetical protein
LDLGELPEDGAPEINKIAARRDVTGTAPAEPTRHRLDLEEFSDNGVPGINKIAARREVTGTAHGGLP